MSEAEPIKEKGGEISRFMVGNSSVRGEIIKIDSAWHQVLSKADYPEPVQEVLGKAIAASLLLAETIKFQGGLTLQIQGEGPVKLLSIFCRNDRTFRGLASWEGEVPAGDLSDLFGQAQLVITIDPDDSEERFQSVVSLEAGSLEAVLEHYFQQSEQIDTHFWLAANDQVCAGMMLQRMPDESVETDLWERVVHLGKTTTEDELLSLEKEEFLVRLFHQEEVKLFDPHPVFFSCSCSRERIEKVLLSLGEEEVRKILSERGQIDIECEYCREEYIFDSVDIGYLFCGDNTIEIPRSTQ